MNNECLGLMDCVNSDDQTQGLVDMAALNTERLHHSSLVIRVELSTNGVILPIIVCASVCLVLYFDSNPNPLHTWHELFHWDSMITCWYFHDIIIQLEQLDRLCSEDTPCRLLITLTNGSYWIPKSKLQFKRICQRKI